MDEEIIDEFSAPSQQIATSVHDGKVGGLEPRLAVVISEGRYMAKVCVSGLARGRGDRKAGRGFSARSRKGLFDWLNSVDWELVTLPAFVTLTYGQAWPSVHACKRDHLRGFYKRLRRACGNIGFLWRLEYQQRGAPHLHLLLFGCQHIDKRKLQAMWGEVIGEEYWDHSVKPCRYPFTRIEGLRSVNGVKWYVGKYLGKVDKQESCHLPSKSGHACSMNESSACVIPGERVDVVALGGEPLNGESTQGDHAAVSPGFNSYTNCAVSGERLDGRYWGVMGRGFVPKAAVTVKVYEGTAVNLSRARLLAMLYHRGGRGPMPSESFTVYKGSGQSEGCVLEDYEGLLTQAEVCCRVESVK